MCSLWITWEQINSIKPDWIGGQSLVFPNTSNRLVFREAEQTPPQRVQQQYVQYCNTSPCASSASKNVRDSLTDFFKLINAYFSLYAFGIFIL